MSNDSIPASKLANAEAKAEKARLKALRPWYKKKRIILPLAFLAIVAVASASGGNGSLGGSPKNSPAASDQSATPSSSPTASKAASGDARAAVQNQFGTFKPFGKKGVGSGVLAIPAGVKVGVVWAKYTGSSNFIVEALDANNQPTGEVPVNTIGAYKGTTGFGFQPLGGTPVKFKIEAVGAWSIAVIPPSMLSVEKMPVTDSGNAAFIYEGGPADWVISHNGSANFVITQETQPMPNLLVNEIGVYSGTVPANAGPCVVIVQADGTWSIKKS